MVEGPTAHVYAYRINREFCGEVINDLLIRSKRIYVSPKELIDKKVYNSESFGKNIVLFVNDYAIRLHLMLYGAIHIYNLDEKLLKPERQVRLMIIGYNKKLVVYNAPIVEIDFKDRLIKRLNSQLGLDPLRPEWNINEVFKRIKQYSNEKIGVLLLDQSVIAGIGNILRNEILFRARVHPERRVKDLSDEEIVRIITIAEELSKQFLKIKLERKRLKPILYVYNKYNKLCKICGSKIRFYFQEPIKRKTFVCEKCQI